MWIVRLALRRPYTFVVAALLLTIGGVATVRQMPADIFPKIDIPVISVVWNYSGLPTKEMEQQILQFSEFSLSGNTEGIRRIETTTLDGVGVIKLYFHEGVNVAIATAQVTAISQTILRRMPPGTQPPVIVRYNATSVPILQLAFTSDTLSESEITDHVNRRVRVAVAAIRGTRIPLPTGGRERAEYRVSMNSSPLAVASLNDLPIQRADGTILFVRDVAFVHEGFGLQTTIARHEGKRSVVMSVLKTGATSTLYVASEVKALLPELRASAPKGLNIELLADQSVFVTRAISSLVTEALIAAGLTALMILLFLGSWRSTVIVAISIPLSVLAALLVMSAMGHTLNTMTLGGLALAVGILVDDATVEVENIHRNLHMDKRLTRAILDGAQQVAVPAFVASLSIGIVFLSVLLLEGPAYYLFMPMGLAVGFSVFASYILSRTLIPTLARYLLPAELAARANPRVSVFRRIHLAFERGFTALQRAYGRALAFLLRSPYLVSGVFIVGVAAAAMAAPAVGRDFFPAIDGGQIRLHVTAPPGTRIEEAERQFAAVENAIADLIPAGDRDGMISTLGVPSGFNLAVSDSANVSSADGEILIPLRHHRSVSTAAYIDKLRRELGERFPQMSFYFMAADMVTQVLNFGLPSAIDLQVAGQQRDKNLAIARAIEKELRAVPGAVDVRLHQILNAPRLHIEVDRTRAQQVGMTQRDVASNVLLAVGSSGQVAPTYWTEPSTGNNYSVLVQIPQQRIDSLDALLNVPMITRTGQQQLRDVGTIERHVTPVFTTRIDVQPTYNVRAAVAGSDLGSVGEHIDAILAAHQKELPPGGRIYMRGQVDSMRSAFGRLGIGIAVAALLVYCLMVVNFQSFKDPMIIFVALPGAGAGIILALLATGTTFNVPSLMGAITSIGVATANSILIVSFANERRLAGVPAMQAALEAGETRLRPVLMTAFAMVIGMLPLALNTGGGGEQNAALARAVIGGLAGATLTTLFIVPVVYSIARRYDRVAEVDPDLVEPGDKSS